MIPDHLTRLSGEAERMVEDARVRFRTDVAETIANAQQLADVFERAIGEVSSGQAFEAWRREFITALKSNQQGGL